MHHYLLVGQTDGNLRGYSDILSKYRHIEISRAESVSKAMELISDSRFDLVIVDEQIQETKGLEFVEMLVKSNPMLPSAVVSSLSSEDFHRASEGLGVLLQLSVWPTHDEVRKLVKRLNDVLSIYV